eukprot:COSAG06_NODE_34840_length_468_cov_1.644986_1_plen_80_part_01
MVGPWRRSAADADVTPVTAAAAAAGRRLLLAHAHELFAKQLHTLCTASQPVSQSASQLVSNELRRSVGEVAAAGLTGSVS